MVVNNNSGLRLYTPSLPDTTKFITNLLLLLHRTIPDGRFGNFIRIVLLYACHLFPEKEASKTEILFFWHSTSTQSVRHHAEKTGRCAKRSAFRFCLSHHHHHSSSDGPHEDKGRSFHIQRQEAPTREKSTWNVWSFIITITHQLMSEERTWWWCSNRTHHPQKKKDTGQSCLLRLRWCRSFLVLTTWVGESTSPVDGYVVTSSSFPLQ